jgi:adenosine deaminase CECR1
MVGSPTMNIHGWRQLVEWSIEYSMLNDAEKSKARVILKIEWERFCQWIIKKYADFPDKLKIQEYCDDPDAFEVEKYGDYLYGLEIQE